MKWEEGGGPYNLYSVATPFTKINANDKFYWCHYINSDGFTIANSNEVFCNNCINSPPYSVCTQVINVYYASSTSTQKGIVYFQTRLRAGNNLCTHDYLPGIGTGSCWCDAAVPSFYINNYQYTDITGDTCVGVNIHSRIEARFIVLPDHELSPDLINNFKSTSDTVMIKELGIAYLKYI